MQHNPNLHSESLQAIFEAGGHFVLAKPDKRPLWRSWDRLRPPLDLVKAMMGRSGSSPGRSVLRALTWTWEIRAFCWRTIQPWRSLRPGVQAAAISTTTTQRAGAQRLVFRAGVLGRDPIG